MGDTLEMQEARVYPMLPEDDEEDDTVEAVEGTLVRMEDLEGEAAEGALVRLPEELPTPSVPPETSMAAIFDIEEAQWGRIMQFAEFAAASKLYGDETDLALAMKALVGVKLGLDIATSFHALRQIRDRINIPAEVQRALARRAGYRIQRVELTDTSCTLRLVVEKSGEVVGESTFTWEDAKRAKLLGNEVWHQYPRRMLVARCSTDLVSDFCPEVLYWDCSRD